MRTEARKNMSVVRRIVPTPQRCSSCSGRGAAGERARLPSGAARRAVSSAGADAGRGARRGTPRVWRRRAGQGASARRAIVRLAGRCQRDMALRCANARRHSGLHARRRPDARARHRAVTVIYSVLRNVVLDPFPYSRSDRLVNVVLKDGHRPASSAARISPRPSSWTTSSRHRPSKMSSAPAVRACTGSAAPAPSS